MATDRQVHFTGTVSGNETFRKEIGSGLVFHLDRDDDNGWTIRVEPAMSCINPHDDFAYVVTPPYRRRNGQMVNTDYGMPAEQAVQLNYEFNFVLSCTDYKAESERLSMVLWPYSYPPDEVTQARAKLGTSRQGKGLLKILRSRISHGKNAAGEDTGHIDSMSFAVDLRIPE